MKENGNRLLDKKIWKCIKKLIYNNNLMSFLMASIFYIFLCYFHIIKTYSLISWLIYFAVIILFIKTDKNHIPLKKEIIVLSGFFAFLATLGTIVYEIKDIPTQNVFNNLLSFSSLISLLGYFNIIFIILVNIFPKIYNYNLSKKPNWINKNWHVFLLSFSIIMFCWLPYFFTYFPGAVTSDSFDELGMIVNNFSYLSDHHPLIHILFIVGPYKIGEILFGTMTAGVAFATISQMIVMSLIFSSFIGFLHKRKVNNWLLLMVLLFFALMPMHGYYSIVMWKDVIFAGLVLLLSMECVKLIEKIKDNNLKFKDLLGFIIVSIFCILFRGNAIYMYIIFAIFTLLVFRKYLKILGISFIIVFSTYIVIKGPVFNYFNVSKAGSAEYIAIPLQQVGRMAFKNVEFTSEEIALIDKLIPFETLGTIYNPAVSDGIKFNANYKPYIFDENKGKYFELWLNLVRKYPAVAMEAYFVSTLGYWYPSVEYPAVAKGMYEQNEYALKTIPKAPKIIRKAISLIELREFPIASIEWSIGLCFWLILIFGVIAFKKNGLWGIYPFVPVLGVWLTIMVASPVYAEFRYVYSAFTTLPLLLICPYFNLKKRLKKSE